MVIVCNGTKEVGKDTFCSFVKEIIGADRCAILSTIDSIKAIAMNCGWNGEKTPKNRKFLSDLKDLLTEWNDFPFQCVTDKIHDLNAIWSARGYKDNETVIFVMCREPQEIQKFVDKFGAKTLLIRRDASQTSPSNHADAEVENYNYDMVIENNGMLEDLKFVAKEFIYHELFNWEY